MVDSSSTPRLSVARAGMSASETYESIAPGFRFHNATKPCTFCERLSTLFKTVHSSQQEPTLPG